MVTSTRAAYPGLRGTLVPTGRAGTTGTGDSLSQERQNLERPVPATEHSWT